MNESKRNKKHTINAFLVFPELGQIIRDYFTRKQQYLTEYNQQIDISCD